MKRFLVYEESSEQSSPRRSMRLISCGYDFVLCAYNYAYVYVMVDNGEGYINGMKYCDLRHVGISMDGGEPLKERLLVETVWFWMCGTIVVHMLYMLHL